MRYRSNDLILLTDETGRLYQGYYCGAYDEEYSKVEIWKGIIAFHFKVNNSNIIGKIVTEE